MNAHNWLFADCVDRRTATIRCHSAVAVAFALALLTAACSPDSATDATATPVTPTSGIDSLDSEPIEVAATGELGSDSPTDQHDADPDYTAEELDALLDTPPTYDEVLDAPDAEPLEAGSPEAAISDIKTELDNSTGTASNQTPVLDQVRPIDAGPTGTVIGIREGRHINEAGEAIQLDDAAALACGNVEIALTAIDDGDADKAVDRLRTASTMAADTSVTTLNSWSPILRQSAVDVAATGPSADLDGAPLIAFLSTCTQGGYEL